jgi:hypothetical protein
VLVLGMHCDQEPNPVLGSSIIQALFHEIVTIVFSPAALVRELWVGLAI